jgi:PAS domain S-box-containing protein
MVMRLNWKELKPIIKSAGCRGNQYLFVLDEEGNILLTNAKMQKELNLKNPRQVKSNFFDLLYPVHIENFRNALRYSVKNNNPYSMEFYLKNGHYHSMKWQVNYLPVKTGSVKTFMCAGTFTGTDNSSGKLPPADKEKAEKIFKAFMRNTPNLIWVVDEDANLVYANHPFFQYFRLDETALNKKIAEILPLAVADALYEKHLKVMQTGLPLEIMEKGKSADGTLATFRVNLFLADESDGKKMVAGIASDQTERKKIERKLEVAHERLVQLSRITSDAIWEWDMQTGEIIRNEKLVELTGYLAEDHKGLAWWLGRIHPEDRYQLNETLKAVTDKGLQSWESEYRFLCADGEYKNMLDRGFVIHEKGMPVKMIGSLSDITGEKLMENLLIEEKLRQYKNISEAALRVQEQERTRLGREMHDNINQILSTIKLFTGMLTPSNEEEAGIKQKTIEYTMLAIEEIRKLSKEMVAPQLDGESLTSHISKVVADIELSTDLKIKFTHDAENELLSPGKKLTLFRIVQEQVKNILKYSKATRAEILLLCNNISAQLIIKDNGVGFDMAKTSSGVGLASIKDRAKFYNGKTEIESAPGKGCQLIVSIPLLD